MSTPLHTVHVRVNDVATGQPTPVRIRFTDEDGQPYAPFGRTLYVAPHYRVDFQGGSVLIDGEVFAYIDGTCEVALPPTPITIQIHKGPEYTPMRRAVTLGPGKLALRLEIEQCVNLRDEGWYSGDIGAIAPNPHAALLEGTAEDLAVVNLLAYEAAGKSMDLYPNLLAFSGQRPGLEAPGCLVVVNTHNSHPSLGSLNLLNCHRVVYPLAFGKHGPDNWTLADWCDQCHRKGGLVVWPQAATCGDLLGEALADLVLGKVDAFEIGTEAQCFNAELYYTLLNAGLKVPVVGGSGKTGMQQALGSPRTYARIQSASLDYRAWIEAVRAGRTFATMGPLLLFTVNGQHPGAVVDLRSGEQRLWLHAETRGWHRFDRVELLANGKVVAKREADGAQLIPLGTEVVLPDGGWLAARCVNRAGVCAQTSPVYVRVVGKSFPINSDAAQRLCKALDRMLRWANTEGRFENDRQKSNLADIFLSAQEKLRGPGASQ